MPAPRLAILAALLLAACQAPQLPAVPEAPTSYAPAVRERMLRITRDELAEWEAWRATQVTQRPGREAVCEGRAEAPESRVANFHRIMAYWNAVSMPAGFVPRNRARFAARANGACAATWSDEPWSAAFISYVMANAGVAPFDFPPSVGHRMYLDHVIRHGDRFGASAPFIARDVADYAPRKGDLVCADRTADVNARLTRIAGRRAEMGAPRAMHCDIVLAVAPGTVETAGGNIGQAVERAIRETDAVGRLRVRPPAGTAPEELTWFAVIENRLGLLPPFAP
jgi:hypothetical protein